jgi:hypothetical protein
MAIIAPESTEHGWSRIRTNGSWVAEVVAIPDLEKEQALRDRLLQRSLSPHGLDREILLRMNRDVWGASD